MNTNEPTVLNINAFPTTKEQIVSGLIGLGFTAVTIGVVAGSFWVVGKVAEIAMTAGSSRTTPTRKHSAGCCSTCRSRMRKQAADWF